MTAASDCAKSLRPPGPFIRPNQKGCPGDPAPDVATPGVSSVAANPTAMASLLVDADQPQGSGALVFQMRPTDRVRRSVS
jgi:hypothetical protein